MPEVFPGPAVKIALFPDGRAERFAVRDEIASPSGSEAVTGIVIKTASGPEAVAGVPTIGARSTLVTVRAVVADPERAFDAVKTAL